MISLMRSRIRHSVARFSTPRQPDLFAIGPAEMRIGFPAKTHFNEMAGIVCENQSTPDSGSATILTGSRSGESDTVKRATRNALNAPNERQSRLVRSLKLLLGEEDENHCQNNQKPDPSSWR